MRRVEHGACAVESGTVLEAAGRRRCTRMRIDKSAKGARTQNKLYYKYTVASFGEDHYMAVQYNPMPQTQATYFHYGKLHVHKSFCRLHLSYIEPQFIDSQPILI